MDVHANSYRDAYSDADGKRNIHPHRRRNTDLYTYLHINANAHRNERADRDSNLHANPYCPASALCLFLAICDKTRSASRSSGLAANQTFMVPLNPRLVAFLA